MFAIKVKGFTADKDYYLPSAEHDGVELFPSIKDAEEELAYIEQSGCAPEGDCEIVPYAKEVAA